MPPDHDASRTSNSSGRRRSRVEAPFATHQNLYELLELPKTATDDDIKRAYRRLALRYHPDKNQNDPEASKKFQDINYANSVLSNPTKRRVYDQYGEMGLKMIEQLGEDRMSLVLRPWVKWLICTFTILTCGCFGCCCCCFCCFQCCCNFCCGKCKPEGMREFEEYQRREGDPENPIQTQPNLGSTDPNAQFTTSSHVTLICEREPPEQCQQLPMPMPGPFEPPPPYSPPTHNSPLAAPTTAHSYGATTIVTTMAMGANQ